MLGSSIIYELNGKYEIFGIDRIPSGNKLYNELILDLTCHDKLGLAIKSINPDYVIHCAAITNVENCENDYSLAYTTNALATKNLVSLLAGEVKTVYISTDSVFNGESGNYVEDDLPSPLNNYAKTKLAGELFIEGLTKNHIIIRTNIFGWNRVRGESFAEWVVHSLDQNKQINMFNDVFFSPLYTNTLAGYIDRLLDINFTGRIHLASLNTMSKYDFGVRLAKIFGLNQSLITPSSIEKSSLKARRPKNTSLRLIKAERLFMNLTTIENEIKKFYQDKELAAR